MNFLRFYSHYTYALIPELHTHVTVNDGWKQYEVDYPKTSDIEQMEEIQLEDIPGAMDYFSQEEIDKMKNEEDAKRKGKLLEEILESEMGRLSTNLDKKLNKQEQKLIEKLNQK